MARVIDTGLYSRIAEKTKPLTVRFGGDTKQVAVPVCVVKEIIRHLKVDMIDIAKNKQKTEINASAIAENKKAIESFKKDVIDAVNESKKEILCAVNKDDCDSDDSGK